MNDLILKILREETGQIDELEKGEHFNNRLIERLSSIDGYDVIFNEDPKMVIGIYHMEPHIRDFVFKKITDLTNLTFDLPEDVSVAYSLHRFNLTEKNIEFLGTSAKTKSHNLDLFRSSRKVYLSVPDAKLPNKTSIGINLISTMYNNKIQTIFLSKFDNDSFLLECLKRYKPLNKFAIVRHINEFKEKVFDAKTEEQLNLDKKPLPPSPPPVLPPPAPKIDPTIEKELKKLRYLNSFHNKKK